jgi:hypothetical protein
VHHDRGDHDRAFALAETALALARVDRRAPAPGPTPSTFLAGLHDDLGRHGLAVDHARQAVHLARGSGDRYPRWTR